MASSITDWIQAIGILLGVPTTAYGITKLFIKDKETKRKLASLEMMSKQQENIVNELHLQVEELIKQGSELKYQSFLMSEANKLMEKQIDLQFTIHSENKKITENTLEFEKSKRLSEIKPFFVVEPDSSSLDEFKFRIVNKGQVARNVELDNVLLEQCYINKIAKRDTLEKNGELVFVGRPRNSVHSRNVEFEVNLLFQDNDDNQYIQTIKKERNHKYTISEPLIKI